MHIVQAQLILNSLMIFVRLCDEVINNIYSSNSNISYLNNNFDLKNMDTIYNVFIRDCNKVKEYSYYVKNGKDILNFNIIVLAKFINTISNIKDFIISIDISNNYTNDVIKIFNDTIDEYILALKLNHSPWASIIIVRNAIDYLNDLKKLNTNYNKSYIKK